jgi:hypothetical protein
MIQDKRIGDTETALTGQVEDDARSANCGIGCCVFLTKKNLVMNVLAWMGKN